jgi:hypothetical protein
LRQRVRSEIRAGKWKKRNCRRCPYLCFARGELRTKSDLRRCKHVKRDICKRCPARGFLQTGSGTSSTSIS